MAIEDEEPSVAQTPDETLLDLRATSTRCRALLHKLCTDDALAPADELSTDDGSARTEGAQARDQMASFNIWSANIGVFSEGRRSIVSRLKSAPKISELIKQLLSMLERDLKKALLRIENQEESLSDSESDDCSDQCSNCSSGQLQPSEDDEALPPRQSSIWTSIQNILTGLRQLALTVHRAGNQHRRIRTERYIARNAELYRLFERLARQKVDHLFPNARATLRERMGQSIATRRVRFLYLEQHQRSTSTLNEPVPVLQQKDYVEEKTAQAASPSEHKETRDVVPPILRSVILSNTTVTKLDTNKLQPTQNKHAESVSSVKISTGKFPSIPKLDATRASFTCPYCFLVCPAKEACGESQWRSHLIHDFEPFFCVFDSCTSPFSCAHTYTGWVTHMREIHTKPRWHCLYCQPFHSDPFSTPGELEGHLTDHHREVAESIRPTLVKHGMLFDRPALSDCPFCGGFPEELQKVYLDRESSQASEALEKHVRDHLVSVALILVPIEMGEELHGEDDNTKSETQRDKDSERDLEGVGDIYELECSNDACDCKVRAKSSLNNWSNFEVAYTYGQNPGLPLLRTHDDPGYRENADIREEWEFCSPLSLPPDCNPTRPTKYQAITDDMKLREYFKIETPELSNQDGRTPLSWATEKGHEAAIKVLLEEGAGVDPKDNYDQMSLPGGPSERRENARESTDIEQSPTISTSSSLISGHDGSRPSGMSRDKMRSTSNHEERDRIKEFWLDDDDGDVRRAALSALGQRAALPDEVLTAVAARLEDHNEDVRKAAVLALGERAALPGEVLTAVAARLDDDNEDVRKAAILALGKQAALPDEVLTAVAARLHDDNGDMRKAAVLALGERAALPDGVLMAVAARLNDDNEDVRKTTVMTLGKQAALPDEVLKLMMSKSRPFGQATSSQELLLFDDSETHSQITIRNAARFINETQDFRNMIGQLSRTSSIPGWATRRRMKRIRIAIIDTGIDDDDDVLIEASRQSDRIISCCSFINDADHGPDYSDYKDRNGHGTHVARLILEMAPAAELVIAKVSNDKSIRPSDLHRITRAINWAHRDMHVNMISMSFGLEIPGDKGMEKAIRAAYKADITMFAAAANCGGNKPRAYPSNRGRGVICIHASDGLGNDGGISPAPLPDTYNFSTLGISIASKWKGNHVFKSGTSFATPIAAALAADVLEFVRHKCDLDDDELDRLFEYESISSILKLMASKRQGYDYIMPLHLWGGNKREDDIIQMIYAIAGR